MAYFPPVQTSTIEKPANFPIFYDYPCYNAGTTQRRIINVTEIQQVKPMDAVIVDGVSTPCVEMILISVTVVVLLDYNTMKDGLAASLGIVDINGNIA